MYFVKDGMVFESCEDGFVEVSIEVKNKVITTSELESIKITPSSHVEASLEDASTATFDEVMARFGLSEDNPIKAKGAAKKKTAAKKTAKE